MLQALPATFETNEDHNSYPCSGKVFDINKVVSAMGSRPDLESLIFDEQIPFNERALQVFAYQRQHCAPYQRFCDALGVGIQNVVDWTDIPCMPVAAYKEVPVCTVPTNDHMVRFRSSATGLKRSQHWIAEPKLYHRAILRGFEQVFGPGPYMMWTYLPGYEDNPDSSLVYMMEVLLSSPFCAASKRLPLEQPLQVKDLEAAAQSPYPLLMWGAAFGLLDLLEMKTAYSLPETSFIIETGGMKTRRREVTRSVLHTTLANGFGVPLEHIYSEYGMAEMLSQAYTNAQVFHLPEWCRVRTYPWYESRNPLAFVDLANLYSCSFLLTGDHGRVYDERTFVVEGRIDPTDFRGCNFLLERD